MSEVPRIVCRFSCGTASAVATKITLGRYDPTRIVITYCDTGAEHPDNIRFLRECETWFGHPVIVLRSDRYRDTWDVWERERFISSRLGAPCTGALKREPTLSFARPDDILVFGYTADEQSRADRFRRQNPEQLLTPLIDAGLRKADCHAIVQRSGIALPAMYGLGFKNNNCVGCPKGGMGYWNNIRVQFPAVFERMAALQRTLGPGSAFLRDGADRITLDQLAPGRGHEASEPDIECSLLCHAAEQDLEHPAHDPN